MDVENAVAQIMNMGFSDEKEVRQALSRAHNNVSAAISFLTGGSSQTPDDVEMEDVSRYGEPRKRRGTDDNCNRENWGESLPSCSTQTGSTVEGSKKPARESSRLSQSSDIEFPLTNLYELEERLNAESWSVPLKHDESLGKCLVAAIRLANEGLADKDEGCRRFMETSMHSSFEKLHMSYMVCRWGPDVQLGIMDMTFLLVKFIAAKLKHGPVPIKLLGLLSQTFDPDTEFHYKNRGKPSRELVGSFDCEPYAVKIPLSSQNEPYGWLVTLINTFGIEGGVHAITHRIENCEEKLDTPELAALLSPFGKCAEFLYPERMKRLLNGSLDKVFSYIQKLSEDDFKRKETGQVSDLFATLKLLFRVMWTSHHVDIVHQLRLDTSRKMLQTAHFNAKMNALKEISKLVEESQSKTRDVKSPIPHEKLLQWMKENEVLETALEGNLHQSQYSDRVKTMMELLGSQLSKEQLIKIWAIQTGKHPIVIENIHAIMAAAAVKFDTAQMDHLFDLIQETWSNANDRHREKLLGFVGKIGRDDKHGRIALKVLELLWTLSQLPQLPHEMVQQALHAHSRILSDSTSVKDDMKKSYAQKCIENIKKSVSVLPSLRHLQEIIQGMKTSYQKVDKSVIQDLQKQYDLIKLGVLSLTRCHREAVAIAATEQKDLYDGVIISGFYTHAEYVKTHLKFLGYILNAGLLYINLQRAKDIWDCLISNPDACESDAEVCFEWFVNGMTDMQPVTQTEMFEQQVLQVPPEGLTSGGYKCFKVFFEHVNLSAGKMRKSGRDFPIVDSQSLSGRDYLWRIALENPSEDIAQSAVYLLLQITYVEVCQRLKREPVELHTHFIDEITRRLDEAVLSVKSLSPLQHAISLTATAMTAPSSPAAAAAVTSLPDRFDLSVWCWK
jgi:ubiquitin carboxyl-terminal hydrolase 9/24